MHWPGRAGLEICKKFNLLFLRGRTIINKFVNICKGLRLQVFDREDAGDEAKGLLPWKEGLNLHCKGATVGIEDEDA